MCAKSTPAIGSGQTVTAGPLTPARDGVLVLSGYGLALTVERGHLCCADGCGKERRAGRFPRAPRPFKRLVVVGHSGSVSFDALRWLHDVGVAFVMLDRDGTVLMAHGASGLDDARLRRAQALAVTDGAGAGMARALLRDKLAGQAGVLATLPDAATGERVRALLPALDAATGAEGLRLVEADAAALYWRAWRDVPVTFAKRDAARVPAHWRAFGQRGSLVANGPRRATNPANALLNYLYAILEAEARLAALAVGLDPGMGVLHADVRARDSLACDLMEAGRPAVDAFVLDLLRVHTFSRDDFFENVDGVCRVTANLTPSLAATAPRWARVLAPIAERVAQALYDGRYVAAKPVLSAAEELPAELAVSPERAERAEHAARARRRALPTKLTENNRSRGRDGVRRAAECPAHERKAALFPACQGCGLRLSGRGRRYCDECWPEQRAESIATFSVAGPAALAARRIAGDDPAHTPDANRKKGERNASHRAAVERWEQEHHGPTDGKTFALDVLPRLQGVPLSALTQATGLSLRYCSLIRRGMCVPHPRHWEALRHIASV